MRPHRHARYNRPPVRRGLLNLLTVLSLLLCVLVLVLSARSFKRPGGLVHTWERRLPAGWKHVTVGVTASGGNWHFSLFRFDSPLNAPLSSAPGWARGRHAGMAPHAPAPWTL